MYTTTPTAKFLVLAPIEHGPDASVNVPAHKFLILSPTENGPDLSAVEETNQSLSPSLSPRERSDSYSSEASDESHFSTLPSGFLYLGHPTRAQA